MGKTFAPAFANLYGSEGGDSIHEMPEPALDKGNTKWTAFI